MWYCGVIFNKNYGDVERLFYTVMRSCESGVHGHFCGVIVFNEHQLPELKSKVFLSK